jgi:hypothetical protein
MNYLVFPVILLVSLIGCSSTTGDQPAAAGAAPAGEPVKTASLGTQFLQHMNAVEIHKAESVIKDVVTNTLGDSSQYDTRPIISQLEKDANGNETYVKILADYRQKLGVKDDYYPTKSLADFEGAVVPTLSKLILENPGWVKLNSEKVRKLHGILVNDWDKSISTASTAGAVYEVLSDEYPGLYREAFYSYIKSIPGDIYEEAAKNLQQEINANKDFKLENFGQLNRLREAFKDRVKTRKQALEKNKDKVLSNVNLKINFPDLRAKNIDFTLFCEAAQTEKVFPLDAAEILAENEQVETEIAKEFLDNVRDFAFVNPTGGDFQKECDILKKASKETHEYFKALAQVKTKGMDLLRFQKRGLVEIITFRDQQKKQIENLVEISKKNRINLVETLLAETPKSFRDEFKLDPNLTFEQFIKAVHNEQDKVIADLLLRVGEKKSEEAKSLASKICQWDLDPNKCQIFIPALESFTPNKDMKETHQKLLAEARERKDRNVNLADDSIEAVIK